MTDWPVHGDDHRPDRDDRLRLDRPRRRCRSSSGISTSTASRFVVIDPSDKDRALLDERGIRFIQAGGDPRQLPRPADAAAHRGRRPGLLRQPLGRHLLARHHGALPRRSARSTSTPSSSPGLGFYFDKSAGPEARTNYALRETVLAARRKQPRRHDGGVLLRRQSRHGLVVRQAGAAQPRRAISASRRPSRRPARTGRALAQTLGVKGIHIAERDTQRARNPKPRDVFVNTWSVEGFLSEGMQPAELGWGTHETLDAGQRPRPRDGLPGRDLPAAARRQHPRALLVPDARARNTASW